jgi:hypothetical protein
MSDLPERILTTVHGIYTAREWDGENHSKIKPVCDKVVILVDQAVTQTQGGILMTDQGQENQTLASTTGILVATGPQAFGWFAGRVNGRSLVSVSISRSTQGRNTPAGTASCIG